MTGNRKKRRYKKQSRIAILGILMVTGMMSGMMLYKTKALQAKDDAYASREAQLQSQIASEEQKKTELEEQEIYVQTKQYIEEIAKSRLGLVNPGEIVLKPNSED